MCPGAIDMVNFGPIDSVPSQFRERNLYVHNATVTLMRTTPEECAQIGRITATKLNSARGAGYGIDSPAGCFRHRQAGRAILFTRGTHRLLPRAERDA